MPALDRRTFLRGSAACLALPWLDAMQPAFAAPRAAARRVLFVFSPNGMNMQLWRPDGEGRTTKFVNTLAPLQPLRSRVTAFSGLAIDGGRAHGDGPGDHARAASSFLTCAHPRKTGGTDIHIGISIDQVIAPTAGAGLPFASLELGMERGAAAGVCDSGYSCAYSSNISWRTADTPVAKETDPRAVFARLFGDPQQASDAAAAKAQRERDRSVLDLVLADAKSLAGKLGSADRQKLDQYLHAVRELEQRLQRLDGDHRDTPVPVSLLAGAKDHAERVALMYELIAIAFATGQTNVATFMLGNAGSNRSYRFLEVPDGHHDLSHHGKDPNKLAAIAKIDAFTIECFAKFVTRLQQQQEGDGDLLKQCLVFFGCGIGDGNSHNHDDLPALLVGEGGGAAKGRGHVKFAKETPMANLHLAIARAMGSKDEKFADSTAVLDLA